MLTPVNAQAENEADDANGDSNQASEESRIFLTCSGTQDIRSGLDNILRAVDDRIKSGDDIHGARRQAVVF